MLFFFFGKNFKTHPLSLHHSSILRVQNPEVKDIDRTIVVHIAGDIGCSVVVVKQSEVKNIHTSILIEITGIGDDERIERE